MSRGAILLSWGIVLTLSLLGAPVVYGGVATPFDRFYATAHRLTRNPPAQDSLSLGCAAQVKRKLKCLTRPLKNPYVSFVVCNTPGVVLVAFAPRRLDHPEKELWLAPAVVGFSEEEQKRRMQSGAFPFMTATSGAMKDWGYVFDRNGDGMADYLCFLDGPISVREADLPPDFPRATTKYTGDQYVQLLFASKYAFYHVVDEDFDGSVDFIVHPTFKPSAPFVDKAVALEWSKDYRRIKRAWYFEEDPSVSAGEPRQGGNDRLLLLAPFMREPEFFRTAQFSELADLLTAVNLAAAECHPWGPARE